jgi:hypothetical protein
MGETTRNASLGSTLCCETPGNASQDFYYCPIRPSQADILKIYEAAL